MPRGDRSFSGALGCPRTHNGSDQDCRRENRGSITAIGAALAAEQRGSGLLNRIQPPGAIAFGIAVIVPDLAIYLQHRVFHAVPLLWRIHQMHHADLDFDVTTGLRFHPLEIVIPMFMKNGVVLAIGASAMAVLAFEVSATSMFNHGDVRMPEVTDRWLRWILVTPDMHRVHHSIVRTETNSNFGFNCRGGIA